MDIQILMKNLVLHKEGNSARTVEVLMQRARLLWESV